MYANLTHTYAVEARVKTSGFCPFNLMDKLIGLKLGVRK